MAPAKDFAVLIRTNQGDTFDACAVAAAALIARLRQARVNQPK
jgi:hypothetical protein